MMGQVEINGVLWDIDNYVVGGQEHFTWKEAMNIAKNEGKRLPTKAEFENLLALDAVYGVYDKTLDIMTPNKEILKLISRGYINPSIPDKILYKDEAFLWSSDIDDRQENEFCQNIWCLSFNSSCSYLTSIPESYRFSLRLVKDML